jgi:hypothetical protein
VLQTLPSKPSSHQTGTHIPFLISFSLTNGKALCTPTCILGSGIDGPAV